MTKISLVQLLLISLLSVAPARKGLTTTWSFDTASAGMDWTPLADTKFVAASNFEGIAADFVIAVVPHNTSSFRNATNITTPHDGILEELVHQKIKSVVRVAENKNLTRLLVVELPASSQDQGEWGRKVGASLVTALQTEKNVTSCVVLLPESHCNSTAFVSECLTTIQVGLYSDKRYKSFDAKDEGKIVQQITFVSSIDKTSTDKALQRGEALAKAIYLARDIVNAPHNSLNSFGLAETAQRLAQRHRRVLKCKILEATDCQQRGMGAFLGVARGSETAPKLIHLTYYKPPRLWTKKSIIKKLGIVGKGLLFDTGGYNIKTAMMELMKFDCGGAAAVLGAAHAIAQLQPEGVEVHFVVAACENMINERAVVPGDILTAMNGKTIEVANTDAEGRLTMADALVYIDKEVGCERIIELSTLTGSCIGALGSVMSGVWSDDKDLLSELQTAATVTGEKLWHMPLEKEYNEQLKSKIADLKNVGGRYGGAITAALFLHNFVDDKPFAHVDMAGPVWNTKFGATGWGTKLVTEWVCQQAIST